MKAKILNLVMLLGFVILSTIMVAQTAIYVTPGSTHRVMCLAMNGTTLDTDCDINLNGDYNGNDQDTLYIPTGETFFMEAGWEDSQFDGYYWLGLYDSYTWEIDNSGSWIVDKYSSSTGYTYVGHFIVKYYDPVVTYDAVFTVTDNGTALPISGATVSVTGEGSDVTNGSGNCTFVDLADGTYNYSVTASGYDAYNSSFTVAGGNVAVPVTMTETAAPTYDANFTVTDIGTSDPIVGALVSVTGQGTANTDGSGQCTFSGLVDGIYDYTVTKSGYDMYNSSFTISGGNATVDVEMTETTAPVYVVNFHVQASSKNIVGATVTLTGYGDQVTDGSGNCSFTDIPDGTYAYSVTATDYQDASGSVLVSGGDVTEYVYIDPLAVGDIHEIEINVYPNPTTDYVTIAGVSNVQWELYSITGQVVLRGSGEKVSMNDLNTGYYVLKIITEVGIVNKKILKQ